jgi:hypothetical protein
MENILTLTPKGIYYATHMMPDEVILEILTEIYPNEINEEDLTKEFQKRWETKPLYE